MINLNEVNWYQDGVTRDYIERNSYELLYPENMTPRALGDAVTYCETFFNPYAEELMRRAGNLEAFRNETDIRKQFEILNNAAKSFGFRFGG